MSGTKRSSTPTLVAALAMLARDIESPDGIANEALREASERMQELSVLLAQCWPLVLAQHGAEHMLDGFSPKPRPEIDALYAAMRREVEISPGKSAGKKRPDWSAA